MARSLASLFDRQCAMSTFFFFFIFFIQFESHLKKRNEILLVSPSQPLSNIRIPTILLWPTRTCAPQKNQNKLFEEEKKSKERNKILPISFSFLYSHSFNIDVLVYGYRR